VIIVILLKERGDFIYIVKRTLNINKDKGEDMAKMLRK
jgi:hypothetical protein